MSMGLDRPMTMKPTLMLCAAVALVLSGCAQREEILPGERLNLRDGFLSQEADPDQTNSSQPISLPAAVASGEWSHRGGAVTRRQGHSALGAGTTLVWATNIGQGNGRKHRITADPVVSAGRVFTLDSRAQVQATSASNGAPIWTKDLTPAGERQDDASGGGLAVVGGVLYVTTGFGDVVALDAATGAEIWTQKLEAAVTAAPAVAGSLVYVVSSDNRAWAIETRDGLIRWQFGGTPSPSSVIGGAGPSVADDLVLFPQSGGEIVATFRSGGVQRWRARVVGSRLGRAYARVTDITAGPVIVGQDVYTGNHSGRVARLSLADGLPVWTAKEGAQSPLVVAGGSVFLVSDQNELLRLSASDGSRIWGVQMAQYEADRPRRYRDLFAHYGPTLAGGRLWVASDTGVLRAYAPESGALVGSVEVPSGAATNPVVANRTMYIVGQNGQLQAYR